MSLNYHVIGQRIRNYRQQRNLSQNSVAEKIDKSATYNNRTCSALQRICFSARTSNTPSL